MSASSASSAADVGERVRRGRLQRAAVQQALTQFGIEIGEQHLAAGDGVCAHAAADLHVQAQRPVAFDALQVDVVETVEHADVAGFPDLIDQVLQDRSDGRGLIERAQRRKGELGQPRADGIALPRRVAHHQPCALQLTEQAMHGLPRQLEPSRQIGQAHGLRLVADGLEHRQRLLNGG